MNRGTHELIAMKASEINEDIIRMRRHFHMYPELSGEEKETSRFVTRRLRALGMEVQSGVGGYGVVGILKGGKPGSVIAWRADMDACAMQEESNKPYKSRIDNVMHLCGHDAHTAIALGIAEVLASVKGELCGAVKFIFQPDEENGMGALRMMADGALENPRPSAIYGLHQGSLGANQSYMETGKLSLHYGTVLFGADKLNIRLKTEKPGINTWAEQERLIYELSRINRLRNKLARGRFMIWLISGYSKKVAMTKLAKLICWHTLGMPRRNTVTTSETGWQK